MLVKLVDINSFYKGEEQESKVSIIDMADTGGLVKQATDSRVLDYISGIKPESGKIYLHILAMGAGEYYGANRNADYFPEANLIDYHKTFETAPGHVFRNHVNKDPTKSIGKVLFSIYNERMHRVEIVAEVDVAKAPDIKERIDNGDWPATSMACRTPYDICSICGNKAHTRQEYCTHITNELGKQYPDGRKVMAYNVAPLTFFDISIVFRPADVTSSVLQKLASDHEHVISSVDEAEAAGLDKVAVEKKAELKKLSELLKVIDGGDVVDSSEVLSTMLNKISDPDLKIIKILKNYKLNETLSTMAHLGISPSVTFLSELIAQKFMGDDGEGAGSLAATVMHSMGRDAMPVFDSDIGDVTPPNLGIANALLPYVPESSYLPEYVEKRAFIRYPERMGVGTNVGYAGNGPHIEPKAYELYRERNIAPKEESKSGLTKLLGTLMSIGGAALAAKWYITQVIEKKMKEANTQTQSGGVKIVLVKTASDYSTAYALAKAAMIRSIPKSQKPTR